MLGTLEPEKKKDWKAHVSAIVHAYHCTRNVAIGFYPYCLPHGKTPMLPIKLEFDVGRREKQLHSRQSIYGKKLKGRLKYAQKKAQEYSEK